MPSAPEGLSDEVVEKAERAQEVITELDDAVIEKAAEAADKLEELPGGSWLAERTEDLAAVASAGLNLLRIPPSAVQAVDLALEINANNQQSPITMIAEPEALPHCTRGFEANQQLVEEAKDSAVLILESAVEVGYEASRGDREAQIRTKRTVLEVGTAAGGLVRGGSKFVRAFRGKRVPPAARRPVARGVEVVDQRGRSLAEFDEIDLDRRMLVEEKSALGLREVPGALRVEKTLRWAEKQVFVSANRKIEALEGAVASRRGNIPEATAAPPIDDFRSFRRLHFRIENGDPAVRRSVATQMERLRVKHSTWEITVEYGSK